MADWLPPEHLVWFVLDVVEALDTSAWHAGRRLGGAGRQGFDPDMLLALLVYAYAVGERSSRQIERLCSSDVAFRVVCAQDGPDHSTIARFRAQHEAAFAGLFAQVLAMCARAGMGRVGTVAVDGTKIGADASLGANRSGAWLQEQAERIVAEAAAVDAAEDALFGDARGDELPPAWCGRDRKSRIAAALAQLDGQDEQDQQASAADAEAAGEYQRRVQAGEAVAGRPPRGVDPVIVLTARRARAQRLFEQASTARAREHASRVIRRTEAALTQAHHERTTNNDNDSDGAQGGPSPAGAARRAGPRCGNVTDPDSRIMKTKVGWVQGYNAQLVVSEDHLILATGLTQHTGDVGCFTTMMAAAVAAAETIATHQPDPAGQDQPQRIGMILADAGYLSEANLTAAGPDRLIAVGNRRDLARAAADDPAHGPPPQAARPIEAMSHRLRTPEGAAQYKRRGATVEPVHGHVKDQVGLRRFARRGIRAAASELHLSTAVVNLLKLHRRSTALA
jgi:transposase